MASFAFVDCKLLVNAVNLSTFARKVTLKIDVAELDDTAFGDTYHSRLGGLKDYSVDVEWNQDTATSAVDQTLFPLLGTVVAITINPTTAANSVTNPAYTGTVLISDYSPLDGSVGDLAITHTSWKGASTLTRATS